jgi:hypothetical protein
VRKFIETEFKGSLVPAFESAPRRISAPPAIRPGGFFVRLPWW